MSDQEVRKAYCPSCGGERSCEVVAKYEEKGGDDYVDWQVDWCVLKCCGCDKVFVQKVSTNSEDISHHDLPNGDFETYYNEQVTYWPAISKRKEPTWLHEYSLAPEGEVILDQAVKEVYGALNSDLPMSAAIAIRTSFDVAAVMLGADESLSFEGKINHLIKRGNVGDRDRELLVQLVNAGGASAHRGWIPDQDQLNDLTAILEHFIETAIVAPKKREILEAKAKALRSAVPSRKKKG